MSLHWADAAAQRLVRDNPDKTTFVVAAGITPSGVVHVGNFREALTSALVAQALRDLGKSVRFIFSWDDFDVFRKVPAGLPSEYAQHLRKSVSSIPDPWGNSDSYAGHFIERFEAELARVGITPEFIRQSARYREGRYSDGIATALAKRATVRAVLDSFRTEGLSDDWLPLAGFCKSCGRDRLTFRLDGERVAYACEDCGYRETVGPPFGGNLKLPWRIDWPMRWAYEGVDFEPGGKDHSSSGGSYDTGKELVKQVYGGKPPQYVAYEFVRAKGETRKISSSSGNVITVSECLEIYQPEILRWMFARASPASMLKIAFDEDTIATHDEFDKALRQARKNGPPRRTLELSRVPGRPAMLDSDYEPPPFRMVTTVLQALDMDAQKTFAHLGGERAAEPQATWLHERITCAANWINSHAAPEFLYRVRKEPIAKRLEPADRALVQRLADTLGTNPTPEGVIGLLREISKQAETDSQRFYATVYDLIIGREKGPKLSTLLESIGPERALALIRPSLALKEG